jgi:LPS sulfotransferase NodH
MPETRFLIACQPRTGSNWLCAMLQSHPRILCHHEVFHPDEIYYAVGHRDGRLAHLGSARDRDADPARFLERLWREDFGRPVVGVKLLGDQAPELRARLLADTGVKKVLLRRRSRVRAYVSLLRARASGFWARTSYDGLAVHVEAGELLDFARRYDAWYAGLRAATRSKPALEVVYEELQRDPRVLARLLEFLGVDSTGVQLGAHMPRQSSDTLREAISNFGALASALRGSTLEPELAEDASAARSSHSAP